MANYNSEEAMKRAIQNGLEQHINRELDAVLEKAINELRERVTAARSAIVLNVLSYFDIAHYESGIIIKVRDDVARQEAQRHG